MRRSRKDKEEVKFMPLQGMKKDSKRHVNLKKHITDMKAHREELELSKIK